MIDEIRQFIKSEAEKFGAKVGAEFNKPFIERNNTGIEALNDNGAFFGLIHPDEDASGPYHDFSIAIFPSDQNKPWLVSLGVGSNGFKNDYELATYPGLRRLFSKLTDENGFCKTDFADIETGLPRRLTAHQDLQHIKNTIKTYSKVLPACQIVENPYSEEGKRVISAFVAGYAKLREWPSNQGHREAISRALNSFNANPDRDDESQIRELLLERKYIVVQGPPGTGKTRLAKISADNLQAKSFFTQFHAETSYSDFIFGMRPDINKDRRMFGST